MIYIFTFRVALRTRKATPELLREISVKWNLFGVLSYAEVDTICLERLSHFFYFAFVIVNGIHFKNHKAEAKAFQINSIRQS